MNCIDIKSIKLIQADEDLKRKWMSISKWKKEIIEKVMHLHDGFSLIAVHDEKLVGMISVYYSKLEDPIGETDEAYIDVIEVQEEYRRKGIAKMLIDESISYASKDGMHQIRAWSSEDKVEAIKMWRALGFGLCPTTTYPKGKEVKGYYVSKAL